MTTRHTPPDSSELRLVAVVAMTPDGTIGRDGEMPWRLRSDLVRFKSMTMGGTLLMGRKTYDSIGRPLPGRRTIVITRNPTWNADGVETAPDPDSAVEMSGAVGEAAGRVFVVGGAEIYRQLVPRCEEIWLTRVWSGAQGDTRLAIDLSGFRVLTQFRVPASARDDVPTEFFRMIRQNS